jgi:PAS domain S-box-containing protein
VRVDTFGPLAIGQVALAWIAFGITFTLIFRRFRDAAAPYRRLAGWIVAGLLVPILMNAAVVLGLWRVEYDFAPVVLAFLTGAAALALPDDGGILQIVPLARSALVEKLREGVIVLDAQSRIADVNPVVRQFLGHPDRLLGLHISEVLSAEHRDVAEPLWGEETAQAEVPFTVDGERRYFDLRISPVTDEAGRRAGRLVLIYDITELRRQQDALRRTNALLQSQNAALDDFAHTVAHDLKTSIQHLVGHAELLHEDGPRLSDEEHRDLASGLVRSGLKLDSIVQELLLFAQTRRGAISPVPLDMEAIFAEALDRLRPTLEDTGARVTVTTDWPDVLGYAAWVETVWYNYVSNAAKYGGRPAHITVCSDPVAADGTVRYWVEDAGPGLTPDEQACLFEPFSRLPNADGAADGHGLGLSIVRRILERLGGTCGVESSGVPGEGSRFWFALPAVPDPLGRGRH